MRLSRCLRRFGWVVIVSGVQLGFAHVPLGFASEPVKFVGEPLEFVSELPEFVRGRSGPP